MATNNTLPIFDPSAGGNPQIGQPVLYYSPVQGGEWNRKYQFVVIPWAGNHPHASSQLKPVSMEQGVKLLEEDAKHVENLASNYAKGGRSWDGGAMGWAVNQNILRQLKELPQKINQQLQDLQNRTGDYAPTPLERELSEKYIPGAATTSAAYFRPEYVKQYVAENGHMPFANDKEKESWLQTMQSNNIDVSDIQPNTENLVEIAPGQWVPKGSAGDPSSPLHISNLQQATNQTYASANFQGGAMPPTSDLSPGMNGPEVKQLQDYLVSMGLMTPEQVATGPGVYGPQTTAAVEALQMMLGIDNSSGPGHFGPLTKQALNQASGNTNQNNNNQGQQNQGTGGTGTQQGNNQNNNQGGTQTGNQNNGQQNTVDPVGTGSPYFMGDYALVRIGGPGYTGGTTWLVDVQNKTLRPFASYQAVQAQYGNVGDIEQYVTTLSSEALGEGGALEGFLPLGSDYAIQENGYAKTLDFNPNMINERYGYQINSEAENAAVAALDGFLKLSQGEGGLPTSFANKIASDPNLMGFYISALSYGGYTLGDVYRDLKKRQLSQSGDNSLDNVAPISATMTREDYANTNEYQVAQGMPQLNPPAGLNVPAETLNLPVYQLPDELFQTLVPVLDVNSPEFQQKFDEARSLMYEAALQMIEAQNEQEQAAAQYMWDRNKGQIEKSLGIQLSNNALDAWRQVEQYYDNFSSRNLFNSGMMNEEVDYYLRQVRENNARLREDAVQKGEDEDFTYYTRFASPEQIQTLIDEDIANGLPREQWRATRWGLVPDQETLNFLSFDNLKSMFPNESDENINRVIGLYLDGQGNVRSDLYRKYAQSQFDTQQDYDQWKTDRVFSQSERDHEKAYAKYTQSDSPFLRAAPGDSAADVIGSGAITPTMANLQQMIQGALQGGYNPGQVTTGGTQNNTQTQNTTPQQTNTNTQQTNTNTSNTSNNQNTQNTSRNTPSNSYGNLTKLAGIQKDSYSPKVDFSQFATDGSGLFNLSGANKQNASKNLSSVLKDLNSSNNKNYTPMTTIGMPDKKKGFLGSIFGKAKNLLGF